MSVAPAPAVFLLSLLAHFPADSTPVRRPAHVADSTSYWQQSVRYEIVARLDEPSGTLSGRERIVYVNRSPDTLTEFYLHLYLNAFRPGSRWAARDSSEGRLRFNHLKDPDYGFERIRASVIGGMPLAPSYPYAPDSTIARWDLPRPLPPGDSLEAVIEWTARPSTVPRRQARHGRRFDFAQWYPKVVVYDRYGWQAHPLYPAGEFYGEFASYDVTLDLPEDQVIGATGVPVEGDPGWDRRKADPDLAIDYQRDWYGRRSRAVEDGRRRSGSAGAAAPAVGRGGEGPGCRGVVVAGGRKCVRFYAEDVHHFAFSLNPEYVYEEGRFKDVVVRALYTPDDRLSWGNGIVVERTVEALRWLDELFGPYSWPQITNLHRIEGGGTEFPMVVMNGSPWLGLILHEVGHNYVMGILANNEWREAFLDEGLTSFQTAWYLEEHVPGFDGYAPDEALVLRLDLEGWSQPVSLVSEDYRDFATYNLMVYAKGELFFHQLRYVVGDEVMRRILRAYYDRWKLKHVSEAALQAVAEQVSGRDLGWLFAQWLHGTPLYDYAIGAVRRRELPDGTWETTVEVGRRVDGWMPVEIGEARRELRGAVVYARASGRPEREVVTFRTEQRPGRLMLDPRVKTHDWNFTNNRERRAFDWAGADWRFDTFVRSAWRRDQTVYAAAPTAWYNDAGELTVGLRLRGNYLGSYNRLMVWLSRGTTGPEPTTEGGASPLDFHFRFANPTWLRRPATSQTLEAWVLEGRTGVRLSWETETRRAFTTPDRTRRRWVAQVMATRNRQFLDAGLWEDGGTAELSRTIEWDAPSGSSHWKLRLVLGGGVAYALRSEGSRLDRRYDAEPFFRPTASVALHQSIGAGWTVGARLFAGGYWAESPPLKQREIPIAGADPYETFGNPMVRSRGAPFVRPEFFYHSPGNGNLRGYAPHVGGRWLGAVNVEVERVVYRRPSGPVRSASVVAFGDAAVADTLAVRSRSGAAATWLADAGVGVRIGLKAGDLSFPLRVEFPLVVSRPAFAHNRRQGTGVFEFRWLLGLEPSF